MRILAIRGRNLASLVGNFVIDLEQGPLSRVNLYAITGPTGAGKSTLLDALCLALFDTVPRLAGSPTVMLGTTDTRLRANDVRNLLRQGTAEGWAEVDFVGSDQHHYRARWEVRRARGRADGQFQPQSMSLRDLATDTPIGRTKSEILEGIATRLGLSFDQFRRSVLLAQGEFAAFLKAREKERADLLERITGTELYGQISIAAYERAKLEGEGLTRLRDQIKGLNPLEADARAYLETEQTTRLAVLHTARTASEEIRRAQDWHIHYQRLSSAETVAAVEFSAATVQQSAAVSRQIAWQEISRLQVLRTSLADLDRHSAALTHVENALATALAAEERATQATATAQIGLDVAHANLKVASLNLSQVTTDLLSARALDARLTDARLRHRAGMAEAIKTQRIAQDAAKIHQIALKDQTERERRHTETANWIAARAHHADLAGQWPRWDAELRRIHTLLEAKRNAEGAVATTKRENDNLSARLEPACQTATASAATLACERVNLVAREMEAANYNNAEFVRRRTELESEREQVRRCAAQVAVICRTRQGWDEALAAHKKALTEAAAAEALAQHCTAELVPIRATYSEAETTLERAMLAADKDVTALRRHLIDGIPCPVCGSPTHPWTHTSTSFDELLKGQRQRVAELRQTVEKLSAEQIRAQTTREGAQHQASAQQIQADARAAEFAVAEQSWALTPFPLIAEQEETGERNDPLAPDLPKRLNAREEELRTQLVAIAHTETAARTAQAAVTTARTAVDASARAEMKARNDLVALERLAATASERHNAAIVEVGRKTQEVESAREILVVPLANIEHWQNALEADPPAFRVRCESFACAYLDHQKTLRELTQAIAHGQTEVAQAETTARLTQETAQQTAEKTIEAQTIEAALTQERASLLNGRSADSVEGELQATQRQTKAIEDLATAALTQARETLITARTQRILCVDDRERQHKAQEAAQAELAPLLAAHHVDLPTLRKHLELGTDWLEQERAALDALERRVETANTRLAERRREREDYAIQNTPTLAAIEVDAALARTRQEEETAQAGLSDVQFRLREDDQRRTQSIELRTAYEAKDQEWKRWDMLRDLIGSADGAKFRTYAQSLTLEVLLTHANRHLEDLARRYRLGRVPGAELELQVVDRDLGNEIRGVHSLSGGETFLVSLALALALASLSSQTTQVESLFIDEGFGSLDADTLDTTLAALDALQAQGRKVGIISHIPALTERIGVQVRVETLGNGRSRVKVIGACSTCPTY